MSLREFVLILIDEINKAHIVTLTISLYNRLVNEGNFILIDKLHRVERGEAGYGTIVVPPEGFSQDDATHNMVIDWLRVYKVNILNVENEVKNLEDCLHNLRQSA